MIFLQTVCGIFPINIFLGPMNFTHDGHGYFYSGWVDATKDDKVNIYIELLFTLLQLLYTLLQLLFTLLKLLFTLLQLLYTLL